MRWLDSVVEHVGAKVSGSNGLKRYPMHFGATWRDEPNHRERGHTPRTKPVLEGTGPFALG